MEFIICDTNKREKQGWPKNASMDFDIGELNDVEITCPKGILDFGMWIICPGTEYGALIEENENITTENTEIWRGNALRKFLQQFIIIPPSGQDYMKVTGDAHDNQFHPSNALISSRRLIVKEYVFLLYFASMSSI